MKTEIIEFNDSLKMISTIRKNELNNINKINIPDLSDDMNKIIEELAKGIKKNNKSTEHLNFYNKYKKCDDE
jgi:hypothetical protein